MWLMGCEVTGQNAPLPKCPLPKRPHILPKCPTFYQNAPTFYQNAPIVFVVETNGICNNFFLLKG